MVWDITAQETSGFLESDPGSLYDAVVGSQNYAPRRRLTHRQRRGDVLDQYRGSQTNTLLNTGQLPRTGFLDFLSNYDFNRDYQDYAALFSPTGRKGYTAPSVVRTF